MEGEKKVDFEDKGDFLPFYAVNPLFSLAFFGLILTFIDVY
jgi:hypothetical protein